MVFGLLHPPPTPRTPRHRLPCPRQVSKAYRKLSILVHPDKNPGEEAREAFEALNEAHRMLKDKDKLVGALRSCCAVIVRLVCCAVAVLWLCCAALSVAVLCCAVLLLPPPLLPPPTRLPTRLPLLRRRHGQLTSPHDIASPCRRRASWRSTWRRRSGGPRPPWHLRR